ncbi:hypothetical protein [Chitinophaga rhizosphaerae]|uniref:hypothetical protein n=1 Tax=Chitinophaga rhizosphaerae TaxID=1864947 RepID=UPI000F813BC6|nr:hypothetical protein [Chitinophaga rhizosphaerae]
MTKIILQPCRDALAYEHFRDTVLKDVPLSSINRFLTPDQQFELAQIYPDGKCRVWGVEPKSKDINVGKWERIMPGDIAFFAKERRIFYSGTVTLTIRNKKAAFQLWKDNGEDVPSTWECMYFLTDVNELDISVEDFNMIKGNKPNANIQGFNVLYEEESRLILEQLGLEELNGGTDEVSGSESQAEDKLKRLPKTDRITTVVARKEHDLLTYLLHYNRIENTCAICHKIFPVSLLVTAHIKRRANCSHEERINRFIVMPLCKLGCDELYERGYISIVNGKVVSVRKSPLTETVRQYIEGIDQNTCAYYNEITQDYFAWHYAHHKRRYFLEFR